MEYLYRNKIKFNNKWNLIERIKDPCKNIWGIT